MYKYISPILARLSRMFWAAFALSSVGIGTAMPSSSALNPPQSMRFRSAESPVRNRLQSAARPRKRVGTYNERHQQSYRAGCTRVTELGWARYV